MDEYIPVYWYHLFDKMIPAETFSGVDERSHVTREHMDGFIGTDDRTRQILLALSLLVIFVLVRTASLNLECIERLQIEW